MAAKDSKGVSRAEFNALKKQVSQLRATEAKEHETLPPHVEDVASRQNMQQEYADQMARLQGARTGALTPDDLRGGASPLGMGTGSRRKR